MSITLTLPKLHLAQQQIDREAKRFNTISCGRRFGKSTYLIHRQARVVLNGGRYGYFAPIYKFVGDYWRESVRLLAPIIKRSNQTTGRIEFITGGTAEFWSLENEDAGRSRKYHEVGIDEAGLVAKLGHIWNSAISPTLVDYKGSAFFAGTPKGMNFFYHTYMYGQDPLRPQWASWQMPSSANPHLPPDEVARLRAEMPERLAQQELDAAFLSDLGGVFRNILQCANVDAPEPWLYGHSYVLGIDLARRADFTAIIVIDVSVKPRRVVCMDRFNQIDWHIQVDRIKALADRYQTRDLIVDQTGVGDPIVQQLQREISPSITGFQFTNSTKAEIVEKLALAFERQEIAILKDDVLIQELQAYEQEKLPSGMIRYSAPENLHDDCVSALCLANYLADSSGGFTYRYDRR